MKVGLITENRINPKKILKNLNTLRIIKYFPYQFKTLICTNAYKGLDYFN